MRAEDRLREMPESEAPPAAAEQHFEQAQVKFAK